MYNRILVFGPSGSGKSTYAKSIAATMQVPVTHLDMVAHTEDFQKIPKSEVIENTRAILSRDRWVIDGNYTSVLFEERLLSADCIIYLEVPTLTSVRRALQRSHNISRAKEQAIGNPANGKVHLVWLKNMLWDYPRNKKKLMFEKIEKMALAKLVILSSDDERRAFLETLMM